MRWLYSLFSIMILFMIFDRFPKAHMAPVSSTELITAHRGSSHLAPENTISAIELAIEEQAGYVEIDVRLTGDGIVVLSHDDSLYRMARLNQIISSTSYAELKHADVGAKFSELYQGEHIPTLEEVMELTRERIKLNIEMKMDPYLEELPHKIAELILKHEFIEHCVVTSFDRTALEIIKHRIPEVRTGLIIGSMQKFHNEVFLDSNIDIISLRSSLINRHIVEQARKHEKQIFAWTVNQPLEMRKMARYGVDSIITDKPRLLFNILF